MNEKVVTIEDVSDALKRLTKSLFNVSVLVSICSIISIAVVVTAVRLRSMAFDQIPCDHGDECELRVLKTWYYTPRHCPSQYCQFHKMYHHTHRSCQGKLDQYKLENTLIAERELELGHVTLPTVEFRRADTPITPSPSRK